MSSAVARLAIPAAAAMKAAAPHNPDQLETLWRALVFSFEKLIILSSLVLVLSPISRLLVCKRGAVDRALIPVSPDQHYADRQASDESAGQGQRRMTCPAERRGVAIHVQSRAP